MLTQLSPPCCPQFTGDGRPILGMSCPTSSRQHHGPTQVAEWRGSEQESFPGAGGQAAVWLQLQLPLWRCCWKPLEATRDSGERRGSPQQSPGDTPRAQDEESQKKQLERQDSTNRRRCQEKRVLSVFTGWEGARGKRRMRAAGQARFRCDAGPPGNHTTVGLALRLTTMHLCTRAFILGSGSTRPKRRRQKARVASVPHRGWGAGVLSKTLPGVGLEQTQWTRNCWGQLSTQGNSRQAVSEEDQRLLLPTKSPQNLSEAGYPNHRFRE